jgi:hypothetical protein
MTNVAVVTVLADSTRERRGSPLLGPSSSAARGRRVFPDPASLIPTSPHGTPVPFPAHQTHRAIRVLRSPR